MERALAALAALALMTLVVEVPATAARPVPAVAAAVVFTLLAAVVPPRLPSTGRRLPAAVYVGGQLVLGYLVFVLAGAGVGAVLLLMVLVAQSVVLLPLPAAAAVTLAVPFVHLGMGLGDGLRSGLGTLAAAVFTAVVTTLLQRERQARTSLAEANVLLQEAAAQSEELATTRERNRLARDIHDGLGHHLTVVSMQVQAARALLAADPARADRVLAQAQSQAVDALDEVRRSVAALRDPRTSPPLPAALQALAAESSAAGLPTALQVEGDGRPLSPDTDQALFRAAQEGLTNVRKHADASAARVVLHYADDGCVRLEVCDDGAGLGEPETAGGFGLVGLRERAARLGGQVLLRSEPGGGTVLRVEVPG